MGALTLLIYVERTRQKYLHMKTLTCLLTVIAAGAGLCSAQIVVNGSFETGPTPPFGGLYIPAPDSTTLSGWTISSGSIDYVGSDYWPAQDGSRSLDMNGHNAGTISQNVGGLSVGQRYRLSFYMAGNNNGAAITFHLQANIGSTSQAFAFDGTGHTYSNMGWTLKTLDFTAANPSMGLSFTSLDSGIDSGNAGPTLDNVSIAAIPEPTGCSLLGTAALLLLSRYFMSDVMWRKRLVGSMELR
jgi:choice-of-anchor C domain-containing protein